jgi:RNA polymerase sigma-70 factor (ECF subfamily)
VRGGCPGAAREVFDRYSGHVQRVVRRALHQKLRRQYDSVDFLQSVWASFFQVPAERYTFANPEELMRFLSQVAYNKVADAARGTLGTAKRDATRERSLDQPTGARPTDGTLAEELPVGDPTPSQQAIADERWESLVSGLPPGHRRVLELLRDGYTHTEIASIAGIHPKIIQRLLRELRRKMGLP